ncbi:kinase-like domain-containing protein [Xylariales sp. PMI_506]|nr:kinase-like domain-containing protein [Xylariales sp. PMI_506]
MSIPIFVNGQPIHEEASDQPPGSEMSHWRQLPRRDNTRLDLQLNMRRQPHRDGDGTCFWSPACLHSVLTTLNVEKELRAFIKKGQFAEGCSPRERIEYYVHKVCGQGIDSTHLKLFAILVLSRKGEYLFNLIDNGVSDHDLPLKSIKEHDGWLYFFKKGTNRPLECFLEWDWREQDNFDSYQWRVAVPCFRRAQNDRVPYQQFSNRTVFPFMESNSRNGRMEFVTEFGGFGEVQQVRIHPACHDFYGFVDLVAERDGPFALKRMLKDRTVTKNNFETEVRMLRAFSGNTHPHIVTLLTAYEHGGEYYLLFPWAECDLARWWEKNHPVRNHAQVRWVAEQCLKIIEAIHFVHFPPNQEHLQPQKKVYGKHGDIKAENILVFPTKDKSNMLIVADLGLTEVHRQVSRSNQSPEGLRRTRDCRPPESDSFQNNGISRAFDIWTLGIVFLNMMTWLIGGNELILAFETKRYAPDTMDRIEAATYFESSSRSQETAEFKVKDSVKEVSLIMFSHLIVYRQLLNLYIQVVYIFTQA